MALLIVWATFARKLAMFHSALTTNLGAASVWWALFAARFYKLVRGIESSGWYGELLNVGYQPTTRYNTLIAGSCILVAANFLLMFAIVEDEQDSGVAKVCGGVVAHAGLVEQGVFATGRAPGVPGD